MFEWSSPCSTIALAALSSFRSACPMFHRLTSVACPIFEWLLPREMRRARGQFAFPQFPHLYICFHSLHTCAQASQCTPLVGHVPPIRMRTFTIAQSHNASFLSRPSLIILIIQYLAFVIISQISVSLIFTSLHTILASTLVSKILDMLEGDYPA